MKFKSFDTFVNESILNENMEIMQILQGLTTTSILASIFNISSELKVIGGSIATGYIIKWVGNLRNEYKEKEVRKTVESIISKLEKNSSYRNTCNELKNTIYTKNPITLLEHSQNAKRIELIKKLVNKVKSILNTDELKFFKEVKDLIRERELEKTIYTYSI